MKLSHTTWGTGSRRALLLHGIGSNKEGWWRVGPAIADLGYTVTAVDLRGHGASPKADSYRFAEFAGDAFEVGEGWDLLLGHSLGGAIAATAMGVRPGFAERVILEDPALFLPGPEIVLPLLMEEFSRPLTFEAQREANPTWHDEDVRIKLEALGQCGPEVFEAIVRDNPSWNLVEEAAGIGVPTLILGAGRDPVTPAEMGDGLAALSENITFVEIPDSSHSMHRDEFEPMMEVIKAWL